MASLAIPDFSLDSSAVRSLKPQMKVISYGFSDPGRVRPRNEDHFLIAELKKVMRVRQSTQEQADLRSSDASVHLFLVADGMGGHRGGQLASALAVDAVEKFLLNSLDWFLQGQDDEQMEKELRGALRAADARVCREADENPQLHGMGTTLTLALVINDELFVAHAGDSRCYLFRDGELHQLTHDHTLASEMARNGLVDPEELANHQFRHVLTNSVGGSRKGVEVDVSRHALQPDDWLLLCTDGLTEMVSHDDLVEILLEADHPRHACDRLVDWANAAGGKDNITVVLAHLTPRVSESHLEE